MSFENNLCLFSSGRSDKLAAGRSAPITLKGLGAKATGSRIGSLFPHSVSFALGALSDSGRV